MRFPMLLALWALTQPASAGPPKLQSSFDNPKDDAAFSLAFAPDGKTLAAGYVTKLDLWETGTWKLRKTVPWPVGASLLESLAFSPDGRFVAGAGREVALCDIWAECLVARLPVYGGATGAVAIAPNGKTIVAGQRIGLRFWDAASREELLKADSLVPSIQAIAFAPDGKTLAAGDIRGAITQWNVAGRKRECVIGRHEGEVNSLAFSADGTTLASGGQDLMIRVWDVKSCRERLRIPLVSERTAAFRIALSPDGRLIATAGRDRGSRRKPSVGVRLWDANTGKELTTLSQGELAFSVAFSPDGKLVAAGLERAVKVWKISNEK